jgi:radical SAM superfamily enzyme YgiQ (UPF0313 family)
LPWWDPTSLYSALLPLCVERSEWGQEIDFNSEIFNPQIWNSSTEKLLLELLQKNNPDFVLISNTTPSHPFALEIADRVKEYSKKIIVILWWPHENETMKNWGVSNWATLLEQQKRKISQFVDFVISWDWEYSLLNLIKGIFNHLDNPKEVFIDLLNSWFFNDVEWKSIIWTLHNWKIFTAKTNWKRIDLEKLPFLYDFFDNNSFFDVFKKETWELKRTAHLMTTRWCIYNCVYCSESTKTYWNKIFYHNHIDYSIKQVLSAIKKWSESAFFEDSVFMWWKTENIINFCEKLIEIWKNNKAVKNFEWGCQMTLEDIIRFWNKAEIVLSKMKEAGCSYIFFWIESLSEEIMKNIDKNSIYYNWKKSYDSWQEKVFKILSLVKSFWFTIWSSILFWLLWETKESIDYTIDWVEELIKKWLLDMVSPNIVTYHPWTLLTKLDWVGDTIDYNSIQEITEPYKSFEEASPWKTSIRISEELMIYIKEKIAEKWQSNLISSKL